ncbi:MAG: DMT family transporter [Cellvibrionaceae bacterium]
MLNITAYITLIVIWSTTPLAVKWSAMDVSFAGAIFWRILLSAILAVAVLKVRGERLFIKPGVWRFYCITAAGIAPNFLLVYWASLWISSGLISVMFSLTPFLMGILSYVWLGKNVFTARRIIALCFAVLGLIAIFSDQFLVMGDKGAYGIAAMLLSILSFAFSSTWLQKTGASIPVLQTTTGGLCFSVPPLALCWWIFDGELPLDMSFQGGMSILYLSIAGSLVGFFLYYFLLHRITATVVSTVGMISPVFALALGSLLAGEDLSVRLIFGAAMVLSGVALYHMPTFRKQNKLS